MPLHFLPLRPDGVNVLDYPISSEREVSWPVAGTFHFAEKRNTVTCEYASFGRNTVEGKSF